MKKVIKGIGKAIKWYAILDVLVLAYIGAGTILKKTRESTGKSSHDINVDALDEATGEWKRYFKKY